MMRVYTVCVHVCAYVVSGGHFFVISGASTLALVRVTEQRNICQNTHKFTLHAHNMNINIYLTHRQTVMNENGI